MSERISEARLNGIESSFANIQTSPECEAWRVGGINVACDLTYGELRTLIATARRERVLAEHVRVLAAEVIPLREIKENGTSPFSEQRRNLYYKASDVHDVREAETNKLLATHKTTLAKLAEGGGE